MEETGSVELEVRYCMKNRDPKRNFSHMAPFVAQGKWTSVECEYQDAKLCLISKPVAYAAREVVAKTAAETGPDVFEASILAKKLGSKAGFSQLAKDVRAFPTKAAAARAYEAAQPRWREINVSLMARLDFLKFVRNLDMRRLLLGTGTAVLKESGRGTGIWVAAGGNLAGLILMAVRAVLQDPAQLTWLDAATPEEVEGAADAFAARFVMEEHVVAVFQRYASNKEDDE